MTAKEVLGAPCVFPNKNIFFYKKDHWPPATDFGQRRLLLLPARRRDTHPATVALLGVSEIKLAFWWFNKKCSSQFVAVLGAVLVLGTVCKVTAILKVSIFL